MSTEQQRQEWRALEQAATPGEWFVEYRDASFYDGEQFINAVVTTGTDDIAGTGAEEQCHADAAFIAAARAAVPALLADVDALTARVDALAAELERVQAQANAEWQEEHAARLVLAEQLKAAEQRAAYLESVAEPEFARRDAELDLLDMLGDMA